MPTTLTDADNFVETITVPTAGDPVRAGASSPLRLALQGFSDRTRYLFNKITNGIPRIRVVSSVSALKALEEPLNGEVAIVFSGNYPRVFFFKVTGSPPSQIDNYLYPADDSSGFWASELWYITTGTGATLRMDPSVLAVPNRVFSLSGNTDDASPSIDVTTSPGSLFGPSVTVNTLKAGDLVLIEGFARFDDNGGVGGGYVYIAVNGAKQELSRRWWSNNIGSFQNMNPSLLYTVPSDGNYTFRMWQMASSVSSGNPTLKGPWTIRALVLRP